MGMTPAHDCLSERSRPELAFDVLQVHCLASAGMLDQFDEARVGSEREVLQIDIVNGKEGSHRRSVMGDDHGLIIDRTHVAGERIIGIGQLDRFHS